MWKNGINLIKTFTTIRAASEVLDLEQAWVIRLLALSHGTLDNSLFNITRCFQDLSKEFCQEAATPCPVFTEGQEFIYNHSGDGNKPTGFCEHAWNDIYPTVMTLAHKGTFLGWMKKDGISIVCCTDGIRPVVFKVERTTNA